MTAVAAWKRFDVVVAEVAQLSPTFRRFTLVGPDVAEFADCGYDQRIKVAFPVPGFGLTALPDGGDWYAGWRALPDDRRPPLRTLTVRAVRADRGELDVVLAVHEGAAGPAMSWAALARRGDPLAIIGPNAGYAGDHGGREFRPGDAPHLLLAGDETAAPAIVSILERLPAGVGQALIEVPDRADALPYEAAGPLRATWLPRGDAEPGSALIPAVRAAVPAAPGGEEVAEVDVDEDVLWEVPDRGPAAGLYCWLAAEAAVVRTLRRYLVTDCGLARDRVAFMGYWRRGRAESD
ncbi:siderophore-interacting protein [Pilimelia anulata]|uniref:Siderophore-interacting protein n=1 Tax=Pilimelia anulata TaxID=53371 RepID=A0A8J3B7Z6_9ACTN|nr:siderophore-interacting protein [Pilimelia anulata]GGK00979.1 siderophore-interacting protein [Pilimelia anulata]